MLSAPHCRRIPAGPAAAVEPCRRGGGADPVHQRARQRERGELGQEGSQVHGEPLVYSFEYHHL